MKQIVQICIAVLAAYGLYKLLEMFFQSRRVVFQCAPVVNVTVNLPESKPKELTAGDHANGLIKIGWNKTCEKVVSPIGWLAGLFR